MIEHSPNISGKITYEKRKLLEKGLKEKLPHRELAGLIGVCPSSIINELNKGRVNGIYTADYAQAETERRKVKQSNPEFSEGKKAVLISLAKKGRSMMTLAQRVGSTPRKVFAFLKAEGLSEGYEQWEGWRIDINKTCYDKESMPMSPHLAKLQNQIDGIKDALSVMAMQIEILSEQLKQRSTL